jgi:hypothetical protein
MFSVPLTEAGKAKGLRRIPSDDLEIRDQFFRALPSLSEVNLELHLIDGHPLTVKLNHCLAFVEGNPPDHFRFKFRTT